MEQTEWGSFVHFSFIWWGRKGQNKEGQIHFKVLGNKGSIGSNIDGNRRNSLTKSRQRRQGLSREPLEDIVLESGAEADHFVMLCACLVELGKAGYFMLLSASQCSWKSLSLRSSVGSYFYSGAAGVFLTCTTWAQGCTPWRFAAVLEDSRIELGSFYLEPGSVFQTCLFQKTRYPTWKSCKVWGGKVWGKTELTCWS